MRTDELDFVLPDELIAQHPPSRRTASRLMHYRRDSREHQHRVFSDLPGILRAGDLLVFNDARVLPARFLLRKQSGGRVEALFLREQAPGRWHVLLKNLGQFRGPLRFEAEQKLEASIAESIGTGEHVIQISSDEESAAILSRVGRMPLPPYIHRQKIEDPRDDEDRERYQTVFAKAPGAVAAPTAALHFSVELFEALAARGIRKTFVTLDVGLGTFKPVTADTLEDHAMHSETYSISSEAASAINEARAEGRRIVAIGTTSARVLESQPRGTVAEKRAATSLLITPPYEWKHVDALLTNFHLPRSTLIALVAAFVGLEEQRSLYRTAIACGYRFFSYGDAMLLE